MKSEGRKKILLVDDDLDITDIVKTALEKRGYEVMTASNGYAALKAVTAHHPDLIIVDLIMPELNGWQFSQILKQDKKYEPYKSIPLIVTSALVDKEKEGPPSDMEMGDYYLAKPFEPDKLFSKIKELLQES